MLFSTAVHAQSPQEIAKKAFLSTVLLVVNDEHGQPIAYGSGFIVEKGVVATNLHVIEGAKSGYAKLVGHDESFELLGLLSIDRSNDLALLRVASLDLPPLELAYDYEVQIGDNVFAVGNPLGLEGTFSQGIVSGIRNENGNKLLQITASISPGSSGGPVLNQSGQVIGVTVAMIEAGQNLNFAIPVHNLQALLKQERELIAIGEFEGEIRSKEQFETDHDDGGRGVSSADEKYTIVYKVGPPQQVEEIFDRDGNYYEATLFTAGGRRYVGMPIKKELVKEVLLPSRRSSKSFAGDYYTVVFKSGHREQVEQIIDRDEKWYEVHAGGKAWPVKKDLVEEVLFPPAPWAARQTR